MSIQRNAERVSAARAAVKQHGGPDAEICDLLSDLMHLCEAIDLDFADELERAHRNYEAEVEEARDEEASIARDRLAK